MILTEDTGRIRLLTLNRPQALNAFNDDGEATGFIGLTGFIQNAQPLIHVPALGAHPAFNVHRLRLQTDMAHDGNAAFNQIGDGFASALAMLDSNASSEKGFSRKSNAPARIARTANGTSPWPVIRMTGNAGYFAATAACNSNPSMPGMRISVTRQAAPAWDAKPQLRKSVADAKSFTA